MEWIWFLCGWSKLTWFLYTGRISLVFNVSMQIGLNFVWVVYIDLSSVWVRTWLDSSVGWNGFGCCVGCRKCHHLSVVDRHWFWFSRTVRKWFDVFGVMIEINRVFESGLQNWLDIRVAIEMQIYWFLCAGLKLTWFWRRDPTRLFFWSRSRTTSVLCAGRKLLGFNL